MQKRFCTCGHMVMVRYQCANGEWRPQVIARGRVKRRSCGQVCPSCGSPLSIHTLR